MIAVGEYRSTRTGAEQGSKKDFSTTVVCPQYSAGAEPEIETDFRQLRRLARTGAGNQIQRENAGLVDPGTVGAGGGRDRLSLAVFCALTTSWALAAQIRSSADRVPRLRHFLAMSALRPAPNVR